MASSSNAAAQLYHRVRLNDPTLVCLRVTPSLSVAHLCEALLTNNTVTQVIVVSDGPTNPTPRTSGAAVIPPDVFAQFLAALHHLPLKSLNVSELRLTDVHVRHIVDLVTASKTLQRLDISRNVLTADSAKRLGAAVASHATLKVLEVASCALGDAGVQQWMGALTPESCRLDVLNLSYNLITAASWKPLSEFVLENTTLTQLHTRGNFIPSAERAALVEPALARNLEAKTKRNKQARPSSALGYLATLDQQQDATSTDSNSKGGASSRRASAEAAAATAHTCPSLEILSRQLDEENREQQ